MNGEWLAFVSLGMALLWVYCVWACASIARTRGRSPVLGALLGLLFPVVGIAIVGLFFMPTKEARERCQRELRAVLEQLNRESHDSPVPPGRTGRR